MQNMTIRCILRYKQVNYRYVSKNILDLFCSYFYRRGPLQFALSLFTYAFKNVDKTSSKFQGDLRRYLHFINNYRLICRQNLFCLLISRPSNYFYFFASYISLSYTHWEIIKNNCSWSCSLNSEFVILTKCFLSFNQDSILGPYFRASRIDTILLFYLTYYLIYGCT